MYVLGQVQPLRWKLERSNGEKSVFVEARPKPKPAFISIRTNRIDDVSKGTNNIRIGQCGFCYRSFNG